MTNTNTVCSSDIDNFPQAEIINLTRFTRRPISNFLIVVEDRKDWQPRSDNVASLYAYQEEYFANAFKAFHAKAWRMGNANKKHRYHIAILHSPEEALPPSNTVAIEKFIQIGRELGIDVTLIEKKHYPHIAEYDALLIRETTAINHHTYRFAKLLEQAVRAANLIGNSLYGVDMKMTDKGPVVIEVNDNPNIDQGIEDGVLGDELYRMILLEIVRRLRVQQAEKHIGAQGLEI